MRLLLKIKMTSIIYNSVIEDAAGGNINFYSDIFKVMFVTKDYFPQKETHRRRSDISNEVAGFGYMAGGMVVPVSVRKNSSGLEISLGSVSLTQSTITAAGAVYYKFRDLSDAGFDELVAFVDFGEDVVSINGIFLLEASKLNIQNGS